MQLETIEDFYSVSVQLRVYSFEPGISFHVSLQIRTCDNFIPFKRFIFVTCENLPLFGFSFIYLSFKIFHTVFQHYSYRFQYIATGFSCTNTVRQSQKSIIYEFWLCHLTEVLQLKLYKVSQKTSVPVYFNTLELI